MSAVISVASAGGTPVVTCLRSADSEPEQLFRSRLVLVFSSTMRVEVEQLRVGFAISRSFGGKTKVYTTKAGGTASISIDELLHTRSLDESFDGQRSYSRTYIILGTKEPMDAADLGPQVGTVHESDSTLIVTSRRFSVYSTAENECDSLKLEVTYTRPDQPENGGGDTDAGFSYEFSTESEHVDTALTQTNHPDDEQMGKKINFGQEDQIDGVDIFSPTLEMSEEHSFTESQFTPTFRRKLGEMVAKTNSGTFREWEAGEVLFLGASARKINRRWIVNFNFRIRRNREVTITTLTAAGATADKTVTKKGWEYIWTRVWRVVANGKVVTGIKSVHVAKVYEETSFADFGFSTGPLP